MTNSALSDIDDLIFGVMGDAGLADAGTYRAPGSSTDVPCRVYVDCNMQQAGDYAPASGPRVIVGLLLVDVPQPQEGATLTIAGDVFVLESEDFRDESISRWVVGDGDLE